MTVSAIIGVFFILMLATLHAPIIAYWLIIRCVSTNLQFLLTPKISTLLEQENDKGIKVKIALNRRVENYSLINSSLGVVIKSGTKERELLLDAQLAHDQTHENIVYLEVTSSDDRQAIPVVLSTDDEKQAVFKTDAIVLNFLNETYVRVWEWSIRYPHVLESRTFIIPHLDELKLLKDYLSLELYVNTLMPRNGVWWPYQRNYGPYVINESLDEVLKMESYRDFSLVKVLVWPNFTKGVTIGYEGQVSPIFFGSLRIYKLIFGALDKPILYVQTPKNLKVLYLIIDNKIMKCTECMYADSYHNCCMSSINISLCGPTEFIVILNRL